MEQTRTVICILALLHLSFFPAASAFQSGDNKKVLALDGFGEPVEWWAVFKLPEDSESGPMPCDCPPPDCSNAPTSELDVQERATGLCYLYADARNPSLRYFRELGYDCLGQGGNDPASHTLKQYRTNNQTAPSSFYWAYFNDQLNNVAQTYQPSTSSKLNMEDERRRSDNNVCSGGDLFNAHAKGAVGFDSNSGGYFIQTSTPNFPDPSPSSDKDDSFIRLGCQANNNLRYAQHMMGISLDMEQLNHLGKGLQTARVCSSNFYDNDLGALLASKNFFQDGLNASKSANFSDLYHALLDKDLAPVNTSTSFNLSLASISSTSLDDTRKENLSLPISVEALRLQSKVKDVQVVIKSKDTHVPPWTLVANQLESDMSVATWWDSNYGTSNICAGDNYTSIPDKFCVDDGTGVDHFIQSGLASYNIENLIQASWHNITWKLTGGLPAAGNHAKWGVTTPRRKDLDSDHQIVTFGDLNMQGYPCSTRCSGSQAGRGGSFFSFSEPLLHDSLVHDVISKACRCRSSEVQVDHDGSFADLRMCYHGCWKKVQERFNEDQLPRLSPNATSFWQN